MPNKYTRDQLLKDIKENLVDVTIRFNDGNRYVYRVTLDLKHMPPGSNFNMTKLDEMHAEHPDIIVAFNFQTNQFVGIDVNSVEYAEALNV